MIIPGDLYIRSMNGMFGIYELHPIAAVFLSAFFMVGLINAFNLIDGLDGLAGSLALTIMLVFAYLFHLLDRTDISLLCLAFSGALIAFLKYNVHPAKIFMGDSGAYIIGLTLGVLSLQLLNEVSQQPLQIKGITFHSAFGIVTALLLIPVFDTIRVFVLRLYNKKHPFIGDNNHLHHRLLKIGFTHTQIALTLVASTIALTLCTMLLQSFNPLIQVLILISTALILNLISYRLCEKKSQTILN